MHAEMPDGSRVIRSNTRRFRRRSVQVQSELMVLACVTPVLVGGLLWIRYSLSG